MNPITFDPVKGLEYIDVGGHRRFLASKPDTAGKFKSLPKFSDHFPVIPSSQWVEVDRRALFAGFGTFDQNGHGSCVGNGWAMAASKARVLAGLSAVLLSPGWFYSLLNGNTDNGAVISDGIEAALNTGFATFQTVGQDPIYQHQMPSGAATEAQRFKLAKVYQINSWEETISALIMPKPFIVVYGYMVGSNFQHFDSYGVAGHDRGPGNHCVLPEALIAGPKTREAKFVGIGDTVFGHDGKSHEVTRVFRRYYNGAIVRISAKGGATTTVTEDHPVLVYRWAKIAETVPAGVVGGHPEVSATKFRDRNYRAHWLRASDIRPGDYVATPRVSLTPTEPAPFRMTEQAAWLLGRYAGDGFLLGGKAATKGFAIAVEAKGEALEAVCRAIRSLGETPTVTPVWTNGETSGEGEPTSFRVEVHNVSLAKKFESWFGRGSVNKRLPLQLFDDVAAQHAMAGLLSADGHRDANGRVVFNSVSPVLAQQVRLLAISAGYRPIIQNVKANRPGAFANAKPSYRVSWQPDGRNGASRFTGGLMIAPVDSVVYIPYSGDVYNFEVEGVHSYIADGVVQGNCNHADGVKKLPDGRWVLDDHNSWGATWGPFGNGRVYLDENHLFGGGDQPDICVIETVAEDPTAPQPPSYNP